jgi:4-hydroxy 2-oxovalerate aldolase
MHKLRRKRMPREIKIFDATLRDGSHAVKHQITLDSVVEFCDAIDNAGIDTVFVGHGNGLGASSLQSGISLHTDRELLTTARAHLKKTKLGILMLPGYGTIKDDLIPAIDAGVDVFKIGTHCTEADISAQHIAFLRERDKEVYGVLMLSHMLDHAQLLEQASKMEEYGALGVILMDSAGALLPDEATARVNHLVHGLNIKVGFHAHNNLGMAVINTMVSLFAGATIVDGTVRGFGAGAGNCQLEAVVAILKKAGVPVSADLGKLLDISENVVATKLQKVPQGLTSYSIMSGYAGVVSTFTEPVKTVAKEFGLNPLEIFEALGKKRVVAGQEDAIIDVATKLKAEHDRI